MGKNCPETGKFPHQGPSPEAKQEGRFRPKTVAVGFGSQFLQWLSERLRG